MLSQEKMFAGKMHVTRPDGKARNRPRGIMRGYVKVWGFRVVDTKIFDWKASQTPLAINIWEVVWNL
jgi:hypothetical protein